MKKNILILAVLIFVIQGISAQEVVKPPKPSEADVLSEPGFFRSTLLNEEAYLKQLSATMRAHLEKIKKVDERKYIELLNEARFSTRNFPGFFGKKHYGNRNAILELEIQSHALAAEYNLGKKNKESIKKELTKTLGKLFELKEKERTETLKELEKEIAELRKSIKIRKQNKNEIIRRRIMDILGERDYFNWD